MLSGCQSYAPKPPDLAAHHHAWLERSPKSPEVAAYALTLSQTGAAAAVTSSTDRLSLAQAELIAMVFNPELRMARSRAGVTSASLDHAGLWDDPILNFGLDRILANVRDPWRAFASVQITLPISGRLAFEKERADAVHHAQLYRVMAQEWQIRNDLRRAWIEWSAAKEKSRITEEFLSRLESIVAIIRRMEDVGELARLHAGLFHIELHSRRSDARSIKAQVRDREIELLAVMGLSPHRAIDTFAMVPAIAFHPVDLPDDAAHAIRERHPQLREHDAEHTVAERHLALQIRKQYPDLIIGPGYGYEDGHNMLMLGLSIPLPLLNRNQQAIAEAFAERDLARAVLETAYEGLLIQLAAARNAVDAAEDQLRLMRETIIPLVDQQYADARHVAELGEVDTLLLLDTLRRQYEAKRDLVSLESQRALAMVRFAELFGPEPEDAQRRPDESFAGNKELMQ